MMTCSFVIVCAVPTASNITMIYTNLDINGILLCMQFFIRFIPCVIMHPHKILQLMDIVVQNTEQLYTSTDAEKQLLRKYTTYARFAQIVLGEQCKPI